MFKPYRSNGSRTPLRRSSVEVRTLWLREAVDDQYQELPLAADKLSLSSLGLVSRIDFVSGLATQS